MGSCKKKSNLFLCRNQRIEVLMYSLYYFDGDYNVTKKCNKYLIDFISWIFISGSMVIWSSGLPIFLVLPMAQGMTNTLGYRSDLMPENYERRIDVLLSWILDTDASTVDGLAVHCDSILIQPIWLWGLLLSNKEWNFASLFVLRYCFSFGDGWGTYYLLIFFIMTQHCLQPLQLNVVCKNWNNYSPWYLWMDIILIIFEVDLPFDP